MITNVPEMKFKKPTLQDDIEKKTSEYLFDQIDKNNMMINHVVSKYMTEQVAKVKIELDQNKLQIAKQPQNLNLITYSYKDLKFEEIKQEHRLKGVVKNKKLLNEKLKQVELELSLLKQQTPMQKHKSNKDLTYIHVSLQDDEEKKKEFNDFMKKIVQERKRTEKKREEQTSILLEKVQKLESEDKEKERKKQEEELQRKKQQLEESIERRNREKEQIQKQLQDHEQQWQDKVKSKLLIYDKPLYKEINKRYKKKIETPQLNEKKKILSEVRELHQPWDYKKVLDEHQQKHEEQIKEVKQKREDEKSKQRQKYQDFKMPPVSKSYKEMQDEIKHFNHFQEDQMKKLKDIKKVQKQLWNDIKQNHQPAVDEDNKLKMQALIDDQQRPFHKQIWKKKLNKLNQQKLQMYADIYEGIITEGTKDQNNKSFIAIYQKHKPQEDKEELKKVDILDLYDENEDIEIKVKTHKELYELGKQYLEVGKEVQKEEAAKMKSKVFSESKIINDSKFNDLNLSQNEIKEQDLKTLKTDLSMIQGSMINGLGKGRSSEILKKEYQQRKQMYLKGIENLKQSKNLIKYEAKEGDVALWDIIYEDQQLTEKQKLEKIKILSEQFEQQANQQELLLKEKEKKQIIYKTKHQVEQEAKQENKKVEEIKQKEERVHQIKNDDIMKADEALVKSIQAKLLLYNAYQQGINGNNNNATSNNNYNNQGNISNNNILNDL